MENNVSSLEKIKIDYKIGDVCIRTDNHIEDNEPKVFTTHKVDMEWGVVYYYKLNGEEESIGIAYIKEWKENNETTD